MWKSLHDQYLEVYFVFNQKSRKKTFNGKERSFIEWHKKFTFLKSIRELSQASST